MGDDRENNQVPEPAPARIAVDCSVPPPGCVYSPNQKRDTTVEYYQGYPGDRFVDVFALDAYHDLDTQAGTVKTGK